MHAHAPHRVLMATLLAAVACAAGRRPDVTWPRLGRSRLPRRLRDCTWSRVLGKRVGKLAPGFLDIDLRRLQDGCVRALLPVAVRAVLFDKGAEASLAGGHGVAHDFVRGVLAARSVT